MSKENEKELRKHLELQTKEELIEQIIIQTRTYENALNIIANKKELIDKAIEELELWQPKIKALKIFRNYLLDILRGKDNETN